MSVMDWMPGVAWVFILGSLALGTGCSPWWYFFTALAGLDLFQYGFSGFCPRVLVLWRLGVENGD